MSATERTFILLKPDAVERNVIGELIARFEKAGLDIIALRMQTASRELVGRHYSEEDLGARVGPVIRGRLIDYVCAGPSVAMVIEGIECVRICRKLVGVTDPVEAAPGTIRGDYSSVSLEYCKSRQQVVRNLVHASATPEEAEVEIALWFEELARPVDD